MSIMIRCASNLFVCSLAEKHLLVINSPFRRLLANENFMALCALLERVSHVRLETAWLVVLALVA